MIALFTQKENKGGPGRVFLFLALLGRFGMLTELVYFFDKGVVVVLWSM